MGLRPRARGAPLSSHARKAKSDKKPLHRLVNPEKICNPKEISNSFNTFFATVGHKLASCIPSSSPDHVFSTFKIRQYKVLFTLTLLPLQKSKLKSKCCQITKPMDSIHAQSVIIIIIIIIYELIVSSLT